MTPVGRGSWVFPARSAARTLTTPAMTRGERGAGG
jgi:hypothetical protein